MQAIRSARLVSGGLLGKFREYFAHNLEVALRKKGLNQQKKAAKTLKVSEATLSSWLNGESAPRDDETWERIAKTLNTSYDQLLIAPGSEPEDPWLRVIRREAAAKGFDLVKSDKK
jgi:transcriptional regulator with XRE-family HTH domain